MFSSSFVAGAFILEGSLCCQLDAGGTAGPPDAMTTADVDKQTDATLASPDAQCVCVCVCVCVRSMQMCVCVFCPFALNL